MALYSLSRDQYDDDDEVPSLHGGIDVVNNGVQRYYVSVARGTILCWFEDLRKLTGSRNAKNLWKKNVRLEGNESSICPCVDR